MNEQNNFSAVTHSSAPSTREDSLRPPLISASRRMMLARVVTIYLATVGLAMGIFFLYETIYEIMTYNPLGRLSIWDILSIVIIPGFIYFGFFFIPFLVTLPLVVPVALIWRTPKRIILLRPFRRTGQSRTLKRLIRKHIAGFGHTYTLADVDIKLRWYVRIPIFLGQISLWVFRQRPIRKLAQIDRLARALRRRRLRNINWCMMTGKTFSVVCDDDHWQPCVSRLLPEMDLILIDLSDIRDHILWEIEECRNLGLLDRVVFLIDQRGNGAASNWVSQCKDDILGGSIRQRLLVYGEHGPMNMRAFHSTVPRVLLQQKDTTYKHPLLHAFIVLCNTAVVTFAILGWFLWWSLPHLTPQWVVKHSPNLDPIVRAYVYKGYDFKYSAPALNQLALDRITKEFGSVAFPVLVRHLRDRITDKSSAGRQVAIALGELGDKRAVGPLTSALQDKEFFYADSYGTRDAVIEALIKLDGDVVKVKNLILALNDKDEYTREYAAEALGHYKDQLALEALLRALSDVDYLVYIAAKESLNRLVEYIGNDAVEPLIRAIDDRHEKVRTYAIKSLGRIGDARAVEPLIQAISDRSVGRSAEDSLNSLIEQIGVQAVEPLIRGLVYEDLYIRRYAAEALGRFDDPRVVEPLIHAMGDKESSGSDWISRTAEKSLDSLIDRRGVDTVEPFIKALGSDNPAVREYAADALGNIGDPRAIEPLKRALNDENFFVRYHAARALDRLKRLGMNRTTPKHQ